ncbi:Protein of unknown function [Gryllus bimaculatus]|nr:Protein of unknown function [Gryllus bimaculatus]
MSPGLSIRSCTCCIAIWSLITSVLGFYSSVNMIGQMNMEERRWGPMSSNDVKRLLFVNLAIIGFNCIMAIILMIGVMQKVALLLKLWIIFKIGCVIFNIIGKVFLLRIAHEHASTPSVGGFVVRQMLGTAISLFSILVVCVNYLDLTSESPVERAKRQRETPSSSDEEVYAHATRDTVRLVLIWKVSLVSCRIKKHAGHHQKEGFCSEYLCHYFNPLQACGSVHLQQHLLFISVLVCIIHSKIESVVATFQTHYASVNMPLISDTSITCNSTNGGVYCRTFDHMKEYYFPLLKLAAQKKALELFLPPKNYFDLFCLWEKVPRPKGLKCLDDLDRIRYNFSRILKKNFTDKICGLFHIIERKYYNNFETNLSSLCFRSHKIQIKKTTTTKLK